MSLESVLLSSVAAPPVRAPESDHQGSDFFSFPVSPTTSITEEFFSALGPMSCLNGWAVMPQERGERRMPGKIDREVLKPSKYHEVGPKIEEVRFWSTQHFSTNVAVILGPASGNVWALDIDVSDLELVLAIEDLAFQHLGHTEFRRIGNDPKRALLYRAETPEQIPASRQMHLLDRETDQPTGHLVEFLGAKKMVTVYGRHHSTLRSFKYAGNMQPASHSVLDVPVVTKDQIEAFTAALHELMPISGGPKGSAGGVYGGWVETAIATEHVTPPKIRTKTEQGRWVVDENGRVVDGRESFLYSVARRVVSENAGAALTTEGQDELRAVIRQLFREHEADGRRWPENKLGGQIAGKVNGLVALVYAGKIGKRSFDAKMKAIEEGERIELAHDRTHGDSPDRATAWLEAPRAGRVMVPAPVGSKSRSTDILFEGQPQPEIPEHLRIPATPEEAIRTVAGGVYAYLEEQIREHYSRRTREAAGEVLKPTARLLKSSAGSGKTTSTMRLVAKHAAHFIASQPTADGVTAPVLFLVPGYELAHQVLDDAIASGIAESDIVFYVGQARSAQYPNGCRFPREVELLGEKGKSASRLCKSDFVNEHGEKETRYCPFYADCLFQDNKKRIAKVKLVIAVHNYATVTLPKEFDACRLVVIDETISFDSSMLMQTSTLFHPRKVPRLTKKEKEAGVDPLEMVEDREYISTAVVKEIQAGRDPSRWFTFDTKKGDLVFTSTRKREMLRTVISMLGRIDDIDEIKPGLSSAQIAAICAKPTQIEIRQEWKFWRLIEDRVELLVPDLLAKALWEEAKRKGGNAIEPVMRAKGKTDRRVHYFKGANRDDLGTVRLSWIAEHNFADRDLLFLDASASEVLLEKGLGKDADGNKRTLVCKEISARDRVRTVFVPGLSLAKSSILPRYDESDERMSEKRQLIVDIRLALVAICSMHTGGVVACASMAVEEVILDKAWAPPSNLVFLHYNAIKGLNFAKGYDAAVSIGCLNVTGRQIDDIVSAYVADDDDPEPMLDPIGENRGPNDPEPKFAEREAVIQLRNGGQMRINQRSVEGTLGQIVYDMVRRENWTQFFARLRGVLRDDVSTFYSLGSYIPEHVVVDEVLPFNDLSAFGKAFDHSRRNQTLIAEPHDETSVEELAAGHRLNEIARTTPSVARNLIHVCVANEIRYAPAFMSDVVDRLVDEGEAEVVYRPSMEPIIKPAGFDADRYIYVKRDEERETREIAYEIASELGWQQVEPGSERLVGWPNLTIHGLVEIMKDSIPIYLERERNRQEAWEDHEVERFERAVLLEELEA